MAAFISSLFVFCGGVDDENSSWDTVNNVFLPCSNEGNALAEESTTVARDTEEVTEQQDEESSSDADTDEESSLDADTGDNDKESLMMVGPQAASPARRRKLTESTEAETSLEEEAPDNANPVLVSTSNPGHSQARFRRMRKGAARVTGWSGAFKKKNKPSLQNLEYLEGRKGVSKMRVMDEASTSEEYLRHERNPSQVVQNTRPDTELTASTSMADFTTKQDLVLCDYDCRPGTPGNLSANHVAALEHLDQLLTEKPLRHCAAHDQEDRSRMLLRFLRGYDFNVETAEARIRCHADFWHDFGMDNVDPTRDLYRDVDSADGLYFRCGRDVYQHPVMVARPCVHLPKNAEDSERAVRRTVYTVAHCCATELAPHSDGIVILYDCDGVRAANCDMTFSKRLISILDPFFPERLVVIIIINNSWALQGLWTLISPLLDPVTKEKLKMCGHDYTVARKWLGEDHPYLKRCEMKRDGNRRKRHHHRGSREIQPTK